MIKTIIQEATAMWTSEIGMHAGKLWSILNTGGESSLAALKKQSKLNDRQLYLALGWLTREGKVKYAQAKSTVMVSLQ
jgi:hypothetical protein